MKDQDNASDDTLVVTNRSRPVINSDAHAASRNKDRMIREACDDAFFQCPLDRVSYWQLTFLIDDIEDGLKLLPNPIRRSPSCQSTSCGVHEDDTPYSVS